MNLPGDVALGDVGDALAELDSRIFDLERSRMDAVVGIFALGLLVWLLSRRIATLELEAQRYAHTDLVDEAMWGERKRVRDLEQRMVKVEGEHAGLDAMVRNSLDGQACRDARPAWRRFLDR